LHETLRNVAVGELRQDDGPPYGIKVVPVSAAIGPLIIIEHKGSHRGRFSSLTSGAALYVALHKPTLASSGNEAAKTRPLNRWQQVQGHWVVQQYQSTPAVSREKCLPTLSAGTHLKSPDWRRWQSIPWPGSGGRGLVSAPESPLFGGFPGLRCPQSALLWPAAR